MQRQRSPEVAIVIGWLSAGQGWGGATGPSTRWLTHG